MSLGRPLILRADRLVASAVLSSVGLVWLLLVGFDALTAFGGEVDEVGEGGYSLAKAVLYTLYTVPRRAYDLFGTSALIGALLGMGGLAATGELTALRAAGWSKLRICAAVVLGLSGLTVAVVILGETVGPAGEHRAQALATAAKSSEIILSHGSGVWARDGNTFINAHEGRVREADQGQMVELSEVRVYDFSPEGRLTALSVAKTASHLRGEWQLHEVRRTHFDRQALRSEELPQLVWKSSLDPRMLALSIVRPRYLSALDLRQNIAYMRRNGLDASAYESAFWSRIFYPLNVLVLLFATMPFAFGALRSGGLGKRIFVGMALAISYYFMQRALVNVAEVYGMDFRLANLLPSILVLVSAAIYFRRYG